MDADGASNEATIESAAQGNVVAPESTCNNNNNQDGKGKELETAAVTSEAEKTLEAADELMEKGSMAVKEGDFEEAVDLFSRALDIRVQHYGELAPDCVKAYYKYGLALLYKAQEEADPLVSAPKKEPEEDNGKDKNVKSSTNDESSTASVSSSAIQDGDSKNPEVPTGSNGKGLEDDDGGAGDEREEDQSDGEEEDSDLDLAWKMLDVARAILEKHHGDTIEKVDILSALAEVALEREDVETSLSDYLSALSILERLVEPDSRLIAELNFRVCLCLEVGSKTDEAIPYCEKAISVSKSRVQRLQSEVNSKSEAGTSSAAHDVDKSDGQPSDAAPSESVTSDKKAEIEMLSGLITELEKKLEDLQQSVANPSSALSEIMEIMATRGKGNANSASAGASSSQMAVACSSDNQSNSPTVSTAHTNGSGVTNLGVVGRGVKRVSTDATETKPPVKRIAPTPVEKEDGKSS